jgi:hypothetical protein
VCAAAAWSFGAAIEAGFPVPWCGRRMNHEAGPRRIPAGRRWYNLGKALGSRMATRCTGSGSSASSGLLIWVSYLLCLASRRTSDAARTLILAFFPQDVFSINSDVLSPLLFAVFSTCRSGHVGADPSVHLLWRVGGRDLSRKYSNAILLLFACFLLPRVELRAAAQPAAAGPRALPLASSPPRPWFAWNARMLGDPTGRPRTRCSD